MKAQELVDKTLRFYYEGGLPGWSGTTCKYWQSEMQRCAIGQHLNEETCKELDDPVRPVSVEALYQLQLSSKNSQLVLREHIEGDIAKDLAALIVEDLSGAEAYDLLIVMQHSHDQAAKDTTDLELFRIIFKQYLQQAFSNHELNITVQLSEDEKEQIAKAREAGQLWS